MVDLQILENKAQIALQKRYDRGRPFVIEFAGAPKSGKGTIISLVEQFFRRQGYKVRVPQEGAEVFRSLPRSSPLYNIRTGIYSLGWLIDAAYDGNFDLFILDRGVVDVFLWMEFWQKKGLLSVQTKQVLQEFFMYEEVVSLLDAVVILRCNLEVSIAREKLTSLIDKEGEYMNHQTLSLLVGVVNEVVEKKKLNGLPLIIKDNNGDNPKEVAKDILSQLLLIFNK